MLTARKLTKVYEAVPALFELDLDVSAGEAFCLLGPNGAGKTTALSLFLGFTRPTSGAAHVGGVHVEADPLGARRQIAYVPEQVRLYPHLSGYDNLTYFLSLARPRTPARDELLALLSAAGLSERDALRPAGGYSKGMRQKVVIALAIAKEACALLLDEPTSGLDPGAIRDLCVALQGLVTRGAAALVVTHDISAVMGVAHRVGIMKAGRLLEVARVADLSEADLADLQRRHFSTGAERSQ
jgi:ABC-2 type transport system ATP-binding protein